MNQLAISMNPRTSRLIETVLLFVQLLVCLLSRETYKMINSIKITLS